MDELERGLARARQSFMLDKGWTDRNVKRSMIKGSRRLSSLEQNKSPKPVATVVSAPGARFYDLLTTLTPYYKA